MNRIALSAGHYHESPGACHGDFCEHPEATRWVEEIRRLMGDRVLMVPTGTLPAKVRWINAQRNVVAAVEVHFNQILTAKGPVGRGCETLYFPGSDKGQRLAERFQNVLAAVYPPNRGVKEGWHRQDRPGVIDYPGDVDGDENIVYFLEYTAMPATILEPEFVHRHHIIHERWQFACERLAEEFRRVIEFGI